VLGYLLVAGFGSATIPLDLHERVFGPVPAYEEPVSLERAVFTILGAGTAVSVLVAGWKLLELRRDELRPGYWATHREAWFLLLWLGLEVAGYFALTPFGAVRRILGVVVVGTLIAGSLAARTCRSPERRVVVRVVVLASVALGLIFCEVDLRDAYAEKNLAEGSARKVHEYQEQVRLRPEYLGLFACSPGVPPPAGLPCGALALSAREPKVWYVGHWGFQHYAERAGMVPVVPDWSELRAGDWLVVPDPPITRQMIDLRGPLREHHLVPVGSPLVIQDLLPLRTVMGYYGTSTGVPLQHLDGPRAAATLYRVKRSFVAASE
jgi:hypothetical protein